jgi:hypothetical protein
MYVSPNSAPSKDDPRDPTIYFIQDDGGQTLQTYLRSRFLQSTVAALQLVPVLVISDILRDLLSALVCALRRFHHVIIVTFTQVPAAPWCSAP